MCIVKPVGNGGRKTTPSGIIYYEDTAEGHAAAAEDQRAAQGGGDIGEATQPPSEEPFPPNTADCSTYTDALWDTPCSKYYKFAHMKYKPQANGSLTAAQVACNWQKLCKNILDPIRDAGYAITLSSGYRSPSYNASIGGSNTSDHVYACAADIQLLSGDAVENAKKLFKWIGKSGLPYSQVIFEGRWVHIAYGGRSPASVAVLATRNGKAPYQNGGGRSGSALPPDLKWA
jgi:hypothetical protein